MFRVFLFVLCLGLIPGMTSWAEEIEEEVELRSHAPCVILLPDDYDPDQNYPLIVGLHGFGDSALNFSRRWEDTPNELQCIFLFLQAPWPYELGENEAGNVWYFWADDDVAARCIADSVRYVKRGIDLIAENYSVDMDNIYTFGFSQGGEMVYLMGQNYPELFAGYAVFGGVWNDDHNNIAELANEFAEPWLLMHTDGDDVLRIDWHFDTAKENLEEFGFSDADFYRYHANGHVMLEEEVQDFTDWISRNTGLYDAELDRFSRMSGNPYDFAGMQEMYLGEILDLMVRAKWGELTPPEVGYVEIKASADNPGEKSRVKAIYAIGALRLTELEDSVTAVISEDGVSTEFLTAALHALRKLDTDSARAAIDEMDWAVATRIVIEGSNAAESGIIAGDIIWKYGGKTIGSISELIMVLGELSDEESIDVVILREGEKISLTVAGGRLGVYLAEVPRPSGV